MSSISVNTITDASGGSTTSINGFTPTVSNMAGRNRIINGGMVFDQRNNGAAQTISAGTTPYTVDRWLAYASGANATSQQVTGTGAFSNALRFTGAASNTDVLVLQRIESKNVSDFSGATIVVQVYLWGSAAGTVVWGVDYANATDNFSAITSVATGSISITTTPTLYTFTVAALPSNVTNGIQVKFDFGALASGVTRTITGVQLEEGSVATPFEHRQYGQELALCQRYFETFVNATIQGIFYDGYSSITGQSMGINMPYKVTKRASPTITSVGSWSTSNTSGSLTFNAGVESFFAFYGSASSGRVYWYNQANSGFTASAEL